MDKKNVKGTIITVLVTVGVCLIAFVIYSVVSGINRAKAVPSAIMDTIEDGLTIQEGDTTITLEELENMVEAVSQLVTEKYSYKEVGRDEKEGTKLGNITIPGTDSLTLIVYSGTISAGIDMSQVKYDIDNEHKMITISMPEPEILSHEIDEKSIESYDVKNNIFEKKTYQDYAEKISEFKEKKVEELTKDGTFLEEVAENTRTALTNFLTVSDTTKDYKIIFDEIPAGNDEEPETQAETTSEE